MPVTRRRAIRDGSRRSSAMPRASRRQASAAGCADRGMQPEHLRGPGPALSRGSRPELPESSADTNRHYVSGPVFGLKTGAGGALMFYGLTARLSLAPAARRDARTQHPRPLLTQPDADIGNSHLRRPVRDLHPPPPGKPPHHRRRLRRRRLRPAVRKALSAPGAVRVQEPHPHTGPTGDRVGQSGQSGLPGLPGTSAGHACSLVVSVMPPR
jgi:hypothetical protein